MVHGPDVEVAASPVPPSALRARAAAERLRLFLEEAAGSSLAAWLQYFDKDNDQRISKVEFSEGMRNLNYGGNIKELFTELDEDGSGELTLNEIDEEQASIWTRFRQWSLQVFEGVDDMLNKLSGQKADKLNQADRISFEQFEENCKAQGWSAGFESLLFSALDHEGDGKIYRAGLRWLGIDLRRMQRKTLAKSKSQLLSMRTGKSKAELKQDFDDFKSLLKNRCSNLVRAWRTVLSPNDTMHLPKTQFLKACAQLGFSHQGKDLWKMLDKDDSGVASLDELDAPAAEELAYFRKFVNERFKTIDEAFTAIDMEKTNKVREKQFDFALRKLGFTRATHSLFEALDKDASRSIELDDLKFLERWQPLPFLLVCPSREAKEEVKKLLIRKYHNYLKAWRFLLDKDNSNRCNWHEFQSACRQLGYNGDVARAWRAFDDDLSGYITLKEIDPEASERLMNFSRWCRIEFGTVHNAFAVFNKNHDEGLTFTEFRSSCRVYGYTGNVRRLFTAFDTGGEGTVSLREVAFLDDWEAQQDEEEGSPRRSSQDSEVTRQNLIRRTMILNDADSAVIEEEATRRSQIRHRWRLKVQDPLKLLELHNLKLPPQPPSSARSARNWAPKQLNAPVKDPDQCKQFWLNYCEKQSQASDVHTTASSAFRSTDRFSSKLFRSSQQGVHREQEELACLSEEEFQEVASLIRGARASAAAAAEENHLVKNEHPEPQLQQIAMPSLDDLLRRPRPGPSSKKRRLPAVPGKQMGLPLAEKLAKVPSLNSLPKLQSSSSTGQAWRSAPWSAR